MVAELVEVRRTELVEVRRTSLHGTCIRSFVTINLCIGLIALTFFCILYNFRKIAE